MSDFDFLAWANRAAEAARMCHDWMQGEFSDSDFDQDGKLSEADAAAFSVAYDAERALATLRKYAAIARAVEAGTHAVVPTALTAENGAKAALIGEFHETLRLRCLECDDGYNDDEVCDECDGAGEIGVKVTIGWDTQKAMHKRVIAHFAAAPQFQEEGK